MINTNLDNKNMIIGIFTSIILGVVILYASQGIQNKSVKWIVVIIGIICILWPASLLLWNIIK